MIPEITHRSIVAMFRAVGMAGCLALLLVLGLVTSACGDDGAGDEPSPSPSPEASPTPTSSLDETPDSVEGAIDLAVNPPEMTVYGKAADDFLSGGGNVALGDFNDDGEPDALIGAPQADGANGTRPDSGEAYVIFGPLKGTVDLLEQGADITIYGASDGDALGFSVYAGDLNDDGVDEIMVGAPGVTAGFDPRTDQGRLYVFYGGDDLDDVSELDLAADVYDLTVTGSEGFSRLSTDIGLGDINGDGRTDLVVSSPFAGRAPGTPPGSHRTAEGEVYVIFGTEDELTGERNIAAGEYDVLLGGTQEFGQFGAAFGVGDFNGDEFDDVVVGAYRNDAEDGRPSAGEAYVFFGDDDISGRLSVLDDAQDVSISGAVAGSALGLPIATGDFNGDGLDDFAIGAQSENVENLVTAGTLRIFYGRDDLPAAIDLSTEAADGTLPGSVAGALLPSALAVDDVTGDGVDDLIISLTIGGTDAGRRDAGIVYVMAGSMDLAPQLDLENDRASQPIIGPSENARLGVAMWVGAIDASGTTGLAALATGVSPDAERGAIGAALIVPLEVE